MSMLNSPTDPLEVLCDNAVKSIRRYVAMRREEIANWVLPEYDPAPAKGYERPIRKGWGW